MSVQGPAIRATEIATGMTHLPPSFDENVFLYASAFTSVMSIACLSLIIACWMVRDLWRDRFNSHPKSLLFGYRAMMGMVALTAFVRSFPEVLYLQSYNDPGTSMQVQSYILSAKRMADTIALGFFLIWNLLMVVIYPAVCIALNTGPARLVVIDKYSSWPRLVQPALTFVCIVLISIAFAIAKVYSS